MRGRYAVKKADRQADRSLSGRSVAEYLRQLNDDLTSVDTVLKTGRVMVDAILNGKLSIAAQKQIPVNAKARIPAEAKINDVDLCVVIGNLMDNAIEENGRLPADRRFIRIYIGTKNTYLYISVTNAAGPKAVPSGGFFVRTVRTEGSRRRR